MVHGLIFIETVRGPLKTVFQTKIRQFSTLYITDSASDLNYCNVFA